MFMVSRPRKGPRRAGPKPDVPTRTCIGCRGEFPRSSLVRVIRGPAGEYGIDRYLRGPGRGAHLCYDRTCFETAIKRKALSRAFVHLVVNAPAPDGEALVQETIAAIEARLGDALVLARRARATESGADVIEAAFGANRVLLLVLAEDAAEATAARFRALALGTGVPVEVFGTRDSLGTAQGRALVAAVAIEVESWATRLSTEFGWRRRLLVAT